MSTPSESQVRLWVKREIDKGSFDIPKTIAVPACTINQFVHEGNTPVWDTLDWHLYGIKSLEKFEDIVSGKIKPNWDDVKFRSENHFLAGSFNQMIQLWPILINYMPDDLKAEAYHTLFFWSKPF